jgi:hypothetical protein
VRALPVTRAIAARLMMTNSIIRARRHVVRMPTPVGGVGCWRRGHPVAASAHPAALPAGIDVDQRVVAHVGVRLLGKAGRGTAQRIAADAAAHARVVGAHRTRIQERPGSLSARTPSRPLER